MCQLRSVVGFDLSLTRTGFSRVSFTKNGDLDSCISGVIVPKLGKIKFLGPARLAFIDEYAEKVLSDCDPESTLIAIEGYSYRSPGNRGAQIGELGGVIRLLFFQLGFEFVVLAPKALKKFAAGNGNADKKMMIASAKKRWGFEAKYDDEVDAFCLCMAALAINSGDKTILHERSGKAVAGYEIEPCFNIRNPVLV